jgi:hypothetical protein
MAERKSVFGENGVVVDAAAFEPWQKQARVARPTELAPLANFATRKLLVWVVCGPLNPFGLVAGLIFGASAQSFLLAAFFFSAPSMLGLIIALPRLGAREWRRSELTTFFVEWSVFTIALYTLGIARAFSIDWSGGFVGVLSMLPNLLSDLPAFVVGLVFAYIIGFLPALACAVLASRVAGKLAFAPIKDAR